MSTGLELSVKRRMSSKIGMIVTYSLGRSEREDDLGRRFPSGFDRTHVATAALSYDFGKGYKAGMKHVLYSGAPLLSDEGDHIEVVKRLPAFYRMDWRFEKRWTIGSRGWVSFVAEVLNTFLAAETLGEECEGSRCSPTKLGPVTIPSIGVEGGY